jgi:signal transduction histidine kinase
MTATIFVVDDRSDPESALTLRDALQNADFAVHTTTVSKRLAETIRREQPDVVLFVSVGLAILKLCQQIKQDEDSPLLMVLLHEPPSAKWAGYEAGIDDFLVRPYTGDELVARLKMALRNRHQRSHLVSSNRGLEQQLADRNRELEHMLRRSQELTVLKDTIVATVSHELRTPLLQMKSSLSLLAEDLKQAPETTAKLVNYAAQATARLESVVNNITHLAASLNLKHEPFLVIDAVNQAQRQIRRKWESSHEIERIRFQLADDLPMVLGDRSAVAQVLQQLIDNGLKFSPQGGFVDVVAESVEGHAGVRISVRDYGIGIPADQVEKIFQAFYQIDHTSTRHFGGTGVGLAIVKLILDGLETRCEVSSHLGQGSQFSFVLPAATQE